MSHPLASVNLYKAHIYWWIIETALLLLIRCIYR